MMVRNQKFVFVRLFDISSGRLWNDMTTRNV
jgi:hypothetical protein